MQRTYYEMSRSVVKGQGHSVKTSFHRQTIAPFEEMGVVESNGDVRILTGSRQIAVCGHALYTVDR